MRLRRPIRRLPMPLRRLAGHLNVRHTTHPPSTSSPGTWSASIRCGHPRAVRVAGSGSRRVARGRLDANDRSSHGQADSDAVLPGARRRRSCGGGRLDAAILAYHGVTDGERFADHMGWLRRHAWPVSVDDVVDAVAGRRPLPERAVLVTFDDGRPSVLDVGLPVLEERHSGCRPRGRRVARHRRPVMDPRGGGALGGERPGGLAAGARRPGTRPGAQATPRPRPASCHGRAPCGGRCPGLEEARSFGATTCAAWSGQGGSRQPLAHPSVPESMWTRRRFGLRCRSRTAA